MVSQRTYDRLRRQLEEDLQSTRAAIAELTGEVTDLQRDKGIEGGVPTNHMADVGTSVYDRERLMSIEQELRDRVAAIEDALHRMDDGSYGTCQRCGRAIPVARLKAMPYSSYCVDCQQSIDDEAAEAILTERVSLRQ